TSSKDDLHRRIGGRCSTHHMKVVFKVCCDPASQPAHDQANNHIPSNGLPTPRGTTTTTTSTTKSSTTSTTPKSTSTTTVTTSQSTTSLKTTSHKSADPHHNVRTTTKKTDTRQPDRNENEVVKNEELTLNSSPSVNNSPFCNTFLSALISLVVTWILSKHS
ncbi:hypothetical protein SK128_014038, partial [Halocaridina rubra]